MTWYYYLIAGVALFLIGGVSMMFLPLRIFIRYLRKNRIDQLVVIVRLALCGLRISYTRSAASNRLSLHLLVGTREFAVPWPETADRFLLGIYERSRRLLLHRAKLEFNFNVSTLRKTWAVFHEILDETRKITWKNFYLEVIFGLANPALAGLAAGCGWAGGGVMLGLMQRFFSFETRPRLKIVPQFSTGELQVHWQSEISLPLYRWLKIALKARKKMLEVFLSGK